jgi:hypothetical protein
MNLKDSNETSSPLRAKLQLFILQYLKSVQNPDCSIDKYIELLELIEYLIGLRNSNVNYETQFTSYSIELARYEFKFLHYSVCLKEILANINITKLSNTSNSAQYNRIKSMLIKIINKTNFADSFNIIYDLSIYQKLGIFEKFFLKNIYFFNIFIIIDKLVVKEIFIII